MSVSLLDGGELRGDAGLVINARSWKSGPKLVGGLSRQIRMALTPRSDGESNLRKGRSGQKRGQEKPL